MIKRLSETKIMWVLGVLILLGFAFSAFTAYKTFTLSPGEQVVTSGGITVAKPTNNIRDAQLREDGVLVVQYEDGTTKEVGYVRGPQGESGSGLPPTEAQVAAAVLAYCTTDNRCDAKAPSAEQVAIAVASYCSTRNNCQGSNGTNGQNATSEQVMAAVQSYCQDGRCTGPQGIAGVNGTNGANGENPVMSCVIRTVNTIDRQYVAWKYPSEDNSLYRNLYMLPVWSQGENCVDLTA